MLNILVGGVDTSQSQLAHAVRLLAAHPDQWERLRADPARPGAGRRRRGAALRADHPVHGADHDGRGRAPRRHLPRRTRRAGVGLARQPRRHRPDEFDITADRGGARVLTFGAGIHYCVGRQPGPRRDAGGTGGPRRAGSARRARRRAGVRHAVRDLRARVAAGSASSADAGAAQAGARHSASSPSGARVAAPRGHQLDQRRLGRARGPARRCRGSSAPPPPGWSARRRSASSSGAGVSGGGSRRASGSRLAIRTS